MREDPLGRDSIFDGVRHSGGNKQQVGGGEGSGAQCESNHVKTIFFWTFARNDTDEEMCYVSLHIGVGLRKILGLSNMAVYMYLGLLYGSKSLNRLIFIAYVVHVEADHLGLQADYYNLKKRGKLQKSWL